MVDDVTFRVVVARMLLENLKGKVVDIDNDFANGDLEHEIYKKIPERYDEVISKDVDKEDCLILQKAIYGLVQAAREFWKNILHKMQGGGFQLSEADPCMLYKEDHQKKLFWDKGEANKEGSQELTQKEIQQERC